MASAAVSLATNAIIGLETANLFSGYAESKGSTSSSTLSTARSIICRLDGGNDPNKSIPRAAYILLALV